MRGMWPIYKRELATYLQSAPTYVVVGLLFLAIGMFFHQLMIEFTEASAMAQAGGPFMTSPEPPNLTLEVIEPVFRSLSAMILFVIPILTMRSIAQERSSGTFEVLMTCPVGDWGVLLGKYLALVTVGFFIVLLSIVYPVAAYVFGRAQGAVPEIPMVVTGLVQLFLIFCAYAAFGLMASSLTTSQVVAAVITLIGLLLWNVVGGWSIAHAGIQAVLQQLSPLNHAENFVQGLLTLKDFVFYVLASFFFLYIASLSLESRRWRV